jgi:hypothetical protein
MSTQVQINDVPPKTQITATAGQTVFTTNWTANAASDVVVYARTSAQDPDDLTQLVSSINYTVAFVGGSEIVEVTFLVARAAGDVITITRDTPADRLNLYTNTNFTPSMLNQDVGILTLVDQQAQLYNEQVAPHYNVSSTPDLGDPITGEGGDIYLPILGANEGWKKNSNNTAIEAITFPSGGGLAPSDATYILQTPWSPSGELPNQQALSPLATGFMTSVTATGVVSTRTLLGTTNQIDVTNGTGTGNPVFSLSNALVLPGTMTFGGNVDADGYNISNIGQANIGNIQISGNTIISTDTNGNINLTPDGTGDLVLDGLNWPQSDGTNGQAVTTDGSGQLGWTSFGAPYTPAALTKVDDTNVTLTLGGTPATALLQAVSLTLGWSGLLDVARGGTGASTVGANGTLAQSDGTKYTFTTATYPSTTTINNILYSSANNTVSQIAAAVGGVLVSNATGVPSMLANPADNYRVLMSKNADKPVWSTAAYPNTAPASGKIMQSDGTNWTSTQATYPSSTNKNHILYSSANNTVGEIGTQQHAVLVSDNNSVPQWSAGLNDGQIIIGKTNDLPASANLTAGTGISITNGANSITITNTAPSTVTPAALTSVSDTNVTITLGGAPATALLQAASITMGWSGQLGVSRGGTGASTVGANGTLAQSNGSIYTFTTATYPSTTTANQLLYSSATNTVSGLTSANSATLVTNSSGVPAWTGSMTNGQVLIGSTGGTPTPATLTAGPGISIANAAGSITVSGTGSGIGWTEVTGATQAMSADNGYVASNAGLVTLTLPTTAAFGTVINVVGKGAGGWKIAQNAGQNIQLGFTSSTVGATGYIASTNQYDSIELLCTTANTTWTVLGGPQGNITVV